MNDFLSVERSSKKARKQYSVEKKIIFRTLLRQFLAHTPVHTRHVLQSGKDNYCSFRGTGKVGEPKYKCKIIFDESY